MSIEQPVPINEAVEILYRAARNAPLTADQHDHCTRLRNGVMDYLNQQAQPAPTPNIQTSAKRGEIIDINTGEVTQ